MLTFLIDVIDANLITFNFVFEALIVSSFNVTYFYVFLLMSYSVDSLAILMYNEIFEQNLLDIQPKEAI